MIIGVRCKSSIEYHIRGNGNFDTLCGLDGDDPLAGTFGTIAPKRGDKINCPQCKAIWDIIAHSGLTNKDFC
jgi:hypothetical protein